MKAWNFLPHNFEDRTGFVSLNIVWELYKDCSFLLGYIGQKLETLCGSTWPLKVFMIKSGDSAITEQGSRRVLSSYFHWYSCMVRVLQLHAFPPSSLPPELLKRRSLWSVAGYPLSSTVQGALDNSLLLSFSFSFDQFIALFTTATFLTLFSSSTNSLSITLTLKRKNTSLSFGFLSRPNL